MVRTLLVVAVLFLMGQMLLVPAQRDQEYEGGYKHPTTPQCDTKVMRVEIWCPRCNFVEKEDIEEVPDEEENKEGQEGAKKEDGDQDEEKKADDKKKRKKKKKKKKKSRKQQYRCKKCKRNLEYKEACIKDEWYCPECRSKFSDKRATCNSPKCYKNKVKLKHRFNKALVKYRCRGTCNGTGWEPRRCDDHDCNYRGNPYLKSCEKSGMPPHVNDEWKRTFEEQRKKRKRK
ncbi:MAG: hypothetical protein ACYTAF_07205 [Planctomycetota bacterium]|jgi:hypothetical protein